MTKRKAHLLCHETKAACLVSLFIFVWTCTISMHNRERITWLGPQVFHDLFHVSYQSDGGIVIADNRSMAIGVLWVHPSARV